MRAAGVDDVRHRRSSQCMPRWFMREREPPLAKQACVVHLLAQGTNSSARVGDPLGGQLANA
jgi:hypothetical protein